MNGAADGDAAVDIKLRELWVIVFDRIGNAHGILAKVNELRDAIQGKS